MNARRARTNSVRAGTAAALGVAAAMLAGCPSDKPQDEPDTTVPPLGGTLAAQAATTGGGYLRPLDAVASSDAATFYFTAMGEGGMGVFRVPGGGGTAQPVVMGAPFVGPFGLAISSDDKTLFVADVTAGLDPGDPAGADDAMGQIFTVPAGGGAATALAGTAGTRPRAIDVANQGGADVLYYSGVLGGQPGLLRIGAAGGAASAVLTGAPFVDPSGVAAARSGDVYVVNTVGGDGTGASVIKVSGGVASEVVAGIGVGYPAGLALSRDEKTLLVSGQEGSQSVVYAVDLATRAVTTQRMGLEGSTDSGGLHRARGADVFAWSGVSYGGGGTVFKVTFK